MNRFAGRLKLLRKEAGLTQQQFADAMRVKRTTIGMYETGKREPDFETMEKIADYFNVTMAYLMGESDTPYTDRFDIIDGRMNTLVEMCKSADADQLRRIMRYAELVINNEI